MIKRPAAPACQSKTVRHRGFSSFHLSGIEHGHRDGRGTQLKSGNRRGSDRRSLYAGLRAVHARRACVQPERRAIH